jgi:hypothetical protein
MIPLAALRQSYTLARSRGRGGYLRVDYRDGSELLSKNELPRSDCLVVHYITYRI